MIAAAFVIVVVSSSELVAYLAASQIAAFFAADEPIVCGCLCNAVWQTPPSYHDVVCSSRREGARPRSHRGIWERQGCPAHPQISNRCSTPG